MPDKIYYIIVAFTIFGFIGFLFFLFADALEKNKPIRKDKQKFGGQPVSAFNKKPDSRDLGKENGALKENSGTNAKSIFFGGAHSGLTCHSTAPGGVIFPVFNLCFIPPSPALRDSARQAGATDPGDDGNFSFAPSGGMALR